jgi:mRNA interferase MazF
MAILPQPGDVVVFTQQGVQVSKYRPHVLASSALYHATRPDIVLATSTTRIPQAPGPLDYVLLDWQSAGLHSPSMFRAFLMSVPVAVVRPPIGKLSARDWAEVQSRLRTALAV